ncbi:hypothetical protein PFICI_13241 [Pestalotiopsis fici W106-1]|uniref:Uncharacterized protein n=1 Tax=Pestalotiopsis fici (strain W106-1 / CGMCC3.15140) TaxID=1229662 RepID=W3WNR8_PESFW|nr:uncharacterized protein PFICI_13241 [Pestalotiopsis fici W106-1]ETS74757.1 hypothetical protein PFICI_13241 [Pestalotiopsis fici W106-1]
MGKAHRNRTFRVLKRLGKEAVNPQTDSPLYNRIPSEIRIHIFEYALTDYGRPPHGHDMNDGFHIRHDHAPGFVPDMDTGAPRTDFATIIQHRPASQSTLGFRTASPEFLWERPGHPAYTRTDTALLLSCRRVYSETHAMPLMLKEHAFAFGSGQKIGGRPSCSYSDYFSKFLGRSSSILGTKQYQLVRRVRIFASSILLWTFPRNIFNTVLKDFGALQVPIEHLRITIRRSSWRFWRENGPYVISPFRRISKSTNMKELMAERTGDMVIDDRAWGMAFQHLPNIKSVTIEFEVTEDKREELEAIVDWAKTWKFPLSGDRHLSAEEQRIERMSWQGLLGHWSDTCTECMAPLPSATESCSTCQLRTRL